MLGRILKRDDDHRQKKVNCSWFVGVEKRAVLTEVMTFGDPHMDKRRCLQVMRKLLYLLNQGQTFTKTEAATVLVSATKLFRFQDIHLRRLVYLVAKELCPIAEEVDILKNSLLKEINSQNIILRANVIRLLCRITNGTSSTQTEEYLKEALMDENHAVSSAGLVCALHLLKKDPGIGNKVSEQVGKAVGTFGLKKFHALCLLFRMQQIESLGVGELARTHIEEILSYELKYNDKAIFYPLSVCLVIRFITQISRASGVSGEPYPGYCKYLKSCIFEEGDMVAIEGLRSMQHLRNISSSEVEAAINAVSSRLLNSRKAVVRFGGFRAMHELGMAHGVSIWEHENAMYCFLNWEQNIMNGYFGEVLKRRERQRHQIQSHLEADDVTQVVKSKTEARAADNLRRRRSQY